VIVPPNRSEPFVDDRGFAAGERIRRWIEEVTRVLNSSNTTATDATPSFVSITASDSPYAGTDNDYILCDMSGGDIVVQLPASGRLWVSREGGSNTLTLQGTVNGTVNPEIKYSGNAAAIAYIDSEWRYV
jgi:hypothetical protein